MSPRNICCRDNLRIVPHPNQSGNAWMEWDGVLANDHLWLMFPASSVMSAKLVFATRAGVDIIGALDPNWMLIDFLTIFMLMFA